MDADKDLDIEALREAGYEIEFVEPEEQQEELEESPKRSIGIGLVVDTHRELPEAAKNIAKFTNTLRYEIGEFEHIEVGVQINPQGKNPPQERSKFMGFVQTDDIEQEECYEEDDDEYFGDDEEEIEMKTLKNKRKKRNK